MTLLAYLQTAGRRASAAFTLLEEIEQATSDFTMEVQRHCLSGFCPALTGLVESTSWPETILESITSTP